jgi:DNA mismatch endonuclease (patch repair protein)
VANPTTSPSFRGLTAASQASSYAKMMNQSQDTAPERVLRSLLWRSGCRYRKNVRTLPGKPDIVFVTRKVVVFCDGDFWHGRNWRHLSAKLRAGSNSPYWLQKIKTNRLRDRRTNQALREVGWTVLRFWESDIRRDPEQIAREICQVVLGVPVGGVQTALARDCQ